MSEEYIYNGKPLSAYELSELITIGKNLKDAEAKREEASKHPKFQKMQFPPPNPEFLKLKNAVIEEIRKKQGN